MASLWYEIVRNLIQSCSFQSKNKLFDLDKLIIMTSFNLWLSFKKSGGILSFGKSFLTKKEMLVRNMVLGQLMGWGSSISFLEEDASY